MSNKKFFMRQWIIVHVLTNYAPPDDQLLNIPCNLNIADALLHNLMGMNIDPQKNNLLIGMNMLRYLQATNQTLSILFAAHKYLIETRNKKNEEPTSQSVIDFQMYQNDVIICEYNRALKEFISTLRIAVDQLLLLHPDNHLKATLKYDCIGGFLKHVKNNNNKIYEKYDMKFLWSLNIAANYIKHDPFQFEEPHMRISLLYPSLLVAINKFKKPDEAHDDYKFYSQYFTNCYHGTDLSNKKIFFWISCDLLISGFNAFFNNIQEDMSRKNKKSVVN